MKTVKHDPNGQIFIDEGPEPVPSENQMLVDMEYVWVSSGTETKILTNLRENPDPAGKSYPVGYTGSGIVRQGVGRFKEGDRVAVYGSPYVYASETIAITPNLAVSVPEGIELYEAAASGLGAIALHGLRRVNTTLGDVAVQVGLGVLGQIAAQLVEAHGADIIAIDLIQQRVDIAREILTGHVSCSGVDQLLDRVKSMTNGRGADMLVLCVSGQAPIADEMIDLLRDRARVCLLGGTWNTLPGWKKARRMEIEYKFVRAGGPGRYDAVYEVDGIDYPIGYVPWTENRNMAAVLRMIEIGKLKVKPLITHCYTMSEAAELYEKLITSPETTLGMLMGINGSADSVPVLEDL